MTDSLWGALPKNFPTVETPNQILAIQGQVLKEATDSLILGSVRSTPLADQRRLWAKATFGIDPVGRLQFELRAPSIDYTVSLLTAYFPLGYYPVAVIGNYGDVEAVAADHEAFRELVKSILGSEAVHLIIRRIMTHVASD